MRSKVAESRVATLTTLDALGRPQPVPICFALEDDIVYCIVDAKPKSTKQLSRLDNLRRRPETALLVHHYEEEWSRLWWVRMLGRGSVVEGGPGWDRGRSLLIRKYEQYRNEPPDGAVIAIAVQQWSGWSSQQG